MNWVNRLLVRGSASKNHGRKQIAKGVLALAGALLGGGSAKAYDPPPADLFPIGVFLQPTSTFDAWKARGVNTVVDFDPNVQPLETWNAAAVSRGLYMIRAPRANLTQDVNEHYLLAWSHHDEPDLNGYSVSTLQSAYNAMKAADPKRPVYINYSGGNVLNQNDAYPDSLYNSFSKAADWISEDLYPVTGWGQPDWIDYSKTPSTARWNVGIATDKLRTLSGGKPGFAYIETSNQQLPWVANDTGATADQVRGETWDAIIHGAKGIVYFPQQIGNGFQYDATPASVAAEITKQDALITSLGGVINSGNDATDNRVTLTSNGATVGDLEGTWRFYQGKKYLFVLNMSSQALTNESFTTAGLTGSTTYSVFSEGRNVASVAGTLTDTFAPYQLHVYDATVVASPAPEPTTLAALIGVAGSCLLGRRRRV